MAVSIRRCIPAVLAMLAFTMQIPASRAEEWPSKPVHILVPFSAGGAVDTVARTLADELGKRWPANIIIDNRPGAGGVIAADVTAKSPPDGYTLCVVASGHPIAGFLNHKLPYDVLKDFTTLTLLGSSPNLALVRIDSPIKSVADLIAEARAKPGQLSYGHSGNGTSVHLAAELFKAMAKVDIVAVPYKGGVPALNDLIGGHLPMTFNNLPESLGMIQAGKVRALAVTPAKRSSFLPDVPTFDEAGVKGYDTGVWWALIAPAGLPADVKAKISRDAAESMKAPAVAERFKTLGAEPLSSTPEEAAALVRADYDKWGPIIKSLGIQAE